MNIATPNFRNLFSAELLNVARFLVVARFTKGAELIKWRVRVATGRDRLQMVDGHGGLDQADLETRLT